MWSDIVAKMDETPSTKTVLVCLGSAEKERDQSRSFPSSNPSSERLARIERVQSSFSDVLPGPSTGSRVKSGLESFLI